MPLADLFMMIKSLSDILKAESLTEINNAVLAVAAGQGDKKAFSVIQKMNKKKQSDKAAMRASLPLTERPLLEKPLA